MVDDQALGATVVAGIERHGAAVVLWTGLCRVNAASARRYYVLCVQFN